MFKTYFLLLIPSKKPHKIDKTVNIITIIANIPAKTIADKLFLPQATYAFILAFFRASFFAQFTRKQIFLRMLSNKLARFFTLIFLLNSYFVYLYYFCYDYLLLIRKEIKISVVYMGIFNLIFCLVMWLFLLVAFKPYSSVNKQFSLDKKMLKKLNSKIKSRNDEARLTCEQNLLLVDHIETMNLQISTRNGFGQVNVCFKCKIIRPDRCYHCSKCSVCILRRDHHCPLLNNMTLGDFVKLYRMLDQIRSLNYLLTFFLIFVSTIPCIFLLINSFYLACINKTSIENNHPPRLEIKSCERLYSDNIFDLGAAENLKQIFGSNILLSVLPIWTSEGDGHHFKLCRLPRFKNYLGVTNPLISSANLLYGLRALDTNNLKNWQLSSNLHIVLSTFKFFRVLINKIIIFSIPIYNFYAFLQFNYSGVPDLLVVREGRIKR
ncbi:palmitoyltransferase ZDHHC15 [Brachionus plicatilis]|uniref:Palmitoyltransferase n=1 Tax=Brachionus plicatilis TaxID=10195 RepID=A0A3M7SQ99_BRAPC|nr:palmitoyltransferase ZDHHC15 [Brachionus plicatilis]